LNGELCLSELARCTTLSTECTIASAILQPFDATIRSDGKARQTFLWCVGPRCSNPFDLGVVPKLIKIFIDVRYIVDIDVSCGSPKLAGG